MAVRPPVDVRREVPGRLVSHLFDDDAELIADRWTRAPGDFAFFVVNVAQPNEPERLETGGIMFACPGCGEICSIECRTGAGCAPPRWTWNGDREKPTFRPSILSDAKKGGCGWHGFLTAGMLRMNP